MFSPFYLNKTELLFILFISHNFNACPQDHLAGIHVKVLKDLESLNLCLIDLERQTLRTFPVKLHSGDSLTLLVVSKA